MNVTFLPQRLRKTQNLMLKMSEFFGKNKIYCHSQKIENFVENFSFVSIHFTVRSCHLPTPTPPSHIKYKKSQCKLRMAFRCEAKQNLRFIRTKRARSWIHSSHSIAIVTNWNVEYENIREKLNRRNTKKIFPRIFRSPYDMATSLSRLSEIKLRLSLLERHRDWRRVEGIVVFDKKTRQSTVHFKKNPKNVLLNFLSHQWEGFLNIFNILVEAVEAKFL